MSEHILSIRSCKAINYVLIIFEILSRVRKHVAVGVLNLVGMIGLDHFHIILQEFLSLKRRLVLLMILVLLIIR